MRKTFYQVTTFLSKIIGRWVFKLFAWFVASGYFLFAPGRVRNSTNLYRRVFPARHHLFHLHCAWRQFHNFTDVFIDRFMVQSSDKLKYRSEGLEYLAAELEKGKGAILVMSHMGNWDVAAQLLMDHLVEAKVLLFMGRKQKEQIEQIQKAQLIESGIRIIAVDQDAGSPLDIVEGIKFLETGGVVSLTGDRIWKKDQR